MLFSKKGQVGQTMTWFMATIIIFFVVFLFLFLVDLMGTSLKVIGLNQEDNSIGATSQTLLAILQRNDGEIKNFILNDEYDKAQIGASKILDDLAEKGLECSFRVFEGSNLKVNVVKVDYGAEYILSLENKEVLLKCR